MSCTWWAECTMKIIRMSSFANTRHAMDLNFEKKRGKIRWRHKNSFLWQPSAFSYLSLSLHSLTVVCLSFFLSFLIIQFSFLFFIYLFCFTSLSKNPSVIHCLISLALFTSFLLYIFISHAFTPQYTPFPKFCYGRTVNINSLLVHC